jgi:hypothetical protein
MTSDTDTTHLVKGSLLAKLGLSVRGIVVILFALTVCILAALKIPVQQELFWLTSAAVGYYFGQQHQKPNA